ncbi:hypothetical protein MMC16_001736 [Acarospora aff. strigata]|nr:hypothetical protein [Acarospora aff. strigata]
MQFSILAVAAFAAAAIASPVLEERTKKTPAQTAQQQCGNNQKLSCCNSVQKQLLGGLIPIQVGLECTVINVLSVLPITQICSTQVACCQSGSQTGLVNIGNVCPVLL